MHTGLAYYLDQKKHLPPEVEEGNIEYKFKIKPENDQRLHNLTTQLQWRLTEHGECHYFIGVDDDGTIVGIFHSDMEESLAKLREMCQTIGAEIISVDKKEVSRLPKLYAAEVLIRRASQKLDLADMRASKVAFVGESGGGKSTLVGVLMGAGSDNGDGSIRSSLLKHRHELISGQTSSVSVEILPFEQDSQLPILLDEQIIDPLPLAMQQKILSAKRVCQMVDMAGDPRYLKTTLSALTSWASPDWIALTIPATSFLEDSSNPGGSLSLSDTSRDWINLVLGLEIPFFIIMTKMDLVTAQFAAEANRILLDYVSQERKRLLKVQLPPYSVSLLQISAVTMTGINNLHQHLYRLRTRHNLRLLNHFTDCMLPGTKFIFCVEGVQRVEGVGVVVLGRVVHGFLDISHDSVKGTLFSIDEKDSEYGVLIKSIHRMRLPVHQAVSGQIISIAIDGVEEDKISKGSLISVGHDSASIDRIVELEADVVGNFEESPSMSHPLNGTLHWLGNRWPCVLSSLEQFYGEVKYRAKFELSPSSSHTLLSLPGTRLIFVCSQFRLQGTASVPKKFINTLDS